VTSQPAVLTATPEIDLALLVAPIVTAFSADPLVRWLLPDSDLYLTHFPAGVRAHAGTAVTNGGARHTADFGAAALWFPAGVDRPAGASQAMSQGIPVHRREAAFAMFSRMGECHPEEPCWHLRLLGVDPPLQGTGYGSALLQETLRDLDTLRVAAFLESTSQASRRLYERWGFEAVDEIQVADSPPIWPMLRKAR
jgi:GNAT superfamily N-acetyltransferase